MEPVSAAQYGVWMFALAATLGVIGTLVGIAVGIKKLFEKPPAAPTEQQPVTRKEAEAFATKSELQGLKDEVMAVKALVDKTQTYLQDRMHELADKLGAMRTEMAIVLEQQKQSASRQERVLTILEEQKVDRQK